MKYLLLITSLFLFNACTDDNEHHSCIKVKGDDGNRGPQGQIGSRGNQGSQGIPGNNAISARPVNLDIFYFPSCISIENRHTVSGFYIRTLEPHSTISEKFIIFKDSRCRVPASSVVQSPTSFFVGDSKLFLSLFGKGLQRTATVIEFNLP